MQHHHNYTEALHGLLREDSFIIYALFYGNFIFDCSGIIVDYFYEICSFAFVNPSQFECNDSKNYI